MFYKNIIKLRKTHIFICCVCLFPKYITLKTLNNFTQSYTKFATVTGLMVSLFRENVSGMWVYTLFFSLGKESDLFLQ